LESANDQGREWLAEFYEYMDTTYPDLPWTMFRQVPMYKFKRSYQEGYVMFTAASTHFSLHILDFALVEELKATLDRASFGKGSIKVKYRDTDLIPVLKQTIDRVIAEK
jgi:hypothetical protein